MGKLPLLEAGLQRRLVLQHLQGRVLEHIVRIPLLLFQHAVEEAPAKKTVMRLRLQRLDRIPGTGLIKIDKAVTSPGVIRDKLCCHLHRVMKDAPFVWQLPGNHRHDPVSAHLHGLVGLEPAQHHPIPLQALYHRLPGPRHEVGPWCVHHHLLDTALKTGDVFLPGLGAVVRQPRVVAQLAGAVDGLESAK